MLGVRIKPVVYPTVLSSLYFAVVSAIFSFNEINSIHLAWIIPLLYVCALINIIIIQIPIISILLKLICDIYAGLLRSRIGLLLIAIFGFFLLFSFININILNHQQIGNSGIVNDVSQSWSIKEKCVIEDGIKICDLFYNIIKENDKERTIKIEGNEVACVNILDNSQKQVKSNLITIDKDETFCTSDFGNVYIDSSLKVSKYFDKILRNDYGEPYYLLTNYNICLWTYSDGNGDIPHLYVSNQVGPSSGWDTKAFCKNKLNGVDIYSYEENE